MHRLLTLVPLVLLSACSGRPPEAEAPGDALLDLWAAVPVGMDGLANADVSTVCDAPFGTWFEDFGVRGLACAANQGLELASAAGRAPARIWTSGPHQLDANGLALNLTEERDFGHYDPEFVEWAIANAVPRTEGARRIAQPIYTQYVQRLARVYWLTRLDLRADGFPETLPTGAPADYAAYLEGGPVPESAGGYEGGISVFSLFDDRGQGIAARLGQPVDSAWRIRYEANTAYGFWIRRHADGTDRAFVDGLRDLLLALDAEWLAANQF